ncbi:chemotaxis protein CheW [Candidatus Halobeggiatoa sp. HSG11]|nr:chemotaxis protein CheW [Candidatus Halobeggiatoa sp. HSG11]
MKPSQALNRPLIYHVGDSSNVYDDEEVIIRRLGFRIGNLGLLIAQRAVSELSDIPQICQLPFTTSWLLGLINLRGNLVPVFDLFNLLQFQIDKKKKTKLLILDQGEAAGAIIINELPEHLSFSINDELGSLPPLPDVIQPYTTSGYEKNNQLWFNFEHLAFFKSLSTKLKT